jgi:hypothetical protein
MNSWPIRTPKQLGCVVSRTVINDNYFNLSRSLSERTFNRVANQMRPIPSWDYN